MIKYIAQVVAPDWKPRSITVSFDNPNEWRDLYFALNPNLIPLRKSDKSDVCEEQNKEILRGFIMYFRDAMDGAEDIVREE